MLTILAPQTYYVFIRCQAGTTTSSLCILTYLTLVTGSYYCYTHFTDEEMEVEEAEELVQDRRLVGITGGISNSWAT